MSMRSHVNPSVDKVIFNRTAGRTKQINIRPISMRGGTRL